MEATLARRPLQRHGSPSACDIGAFGGGGCVRSGWPLRLESFDSLLVACGRGRSL